MICKIYNNFRLFSITDCQFFFDFDNTITPFDVLDDIIMRFSINDDWAALESAWQSGEISSLECLEGQLSSVRVSRKDLLGYLFHIKVDPYVHKIFDLLNREGMKPVILSDSFTFIIKEILKNNGIKDVQVYANRLSFSGNKLIPSFPYKHKNCIICAHCKKENLLSKYIRDKVIIYVGDGKSDICPSQCANIVFAKGKLLQHFISAGRSCLEFNTMNDIYNHFKELKYEQETKKD